MEEKLEGLLEELEEQLEQRLAAISGKANRKKLLIGLSAGVVVLVIAFGVLSLLRSRRFAADVSNSRAELQQLIDRQFQDEKGL